MPDQEFSKDTSSRTWKDWAQGLLVLLAGLTIAHLGVTLFLLSEMGADTFTVLIQGISRRTGLSIGTCHVAMLVLLMAVMLLTTKGYVKPGTVVCAFCGGWIIIFAGAAGHFDAGRLCDSGVRHVYYHQKQLRNRAQRPDRDDFQR